jgi:hypothetical protein
MVIGLYSKRGAAGDVAPFGERAVDDGSREQPKNATLSALASASDWSVDAAKADREFFISQFFAHFRWQ